MCDIINHKYLHLWKATAKNSFTITQDNFPIYEPKLLIFEFASTLNLEKKTAKHIGSSNTFICGIRCP